MSDRSRKAEDASQSINMVLQGVLQHAQRQHGAVLTLQQQWPRIVGKDLARHTKPVSARNGRLVIHVDRPGDNFSLRYQRQRVLERAQALTGGKVTELVIRAGSV